MQSGTATSLVSCLLEEECARSQTPPEGGHHLGSGSRLPFLSVWGFISTEHLLPEAEAQLAALTLGLHGSLRSGVSLVSLFSLAASQGRDTRGFFVLNALLKVAI